VLVFVCDMLVFIHDLYDLLSMYYNIYFHYVLTFLHISLPLCVFVVFSCYLSFSFAVIIYSVGVDDVVGLEASLEDEESSIMLVEGFRELSCSKWLACV